MTTRVIELGRRASSPKRLARLPNIYLSEWYQFIIFTSVTLANPKPILPKLEISATSLQCVSFVEMLCQSETNWLQNYRYGISQKVRNRTNAFAASESQGIFSTRIKNSLVAIGRRLSSGFLCKVKLYRYKESTNVRDSKLTNLI